MMGEAMYEKSLDPALLDVARVRFQRLLSGKHFHIKKDMVDRLIPGSIDLHVHAWPDAYVARQYSEIEIGRRATDVGMAAVVFKCHSTPSAGRAGLVQEAVDEYAGKAGKTPTQIIGGVVLNYCVGGINPHAVETCAKFGGRYVWLPSVHASHHFRVQGKEGGIPVLDDQKRVLPELREVLKIIAEWDMILGLAHQSTEERFLIVREAKEIGVKRISADHPQGLINKMTVDQMKEMAEMGVDMCIQNQTIFSHELNDETMEMIAKIPGERLVYGSDLTQWGAVHPVDGIRMLVEILLKFGVQEETLKKIFIENPRQLLFE
jgi:hypothetical protein